MLQQHNELVVAFDGWGVDQIAEDNAQVLGTFVKKNFVLHRGDIPEESEYWMEEASEVLVYQVAN